MGQDGEIEARERDAGVYDAEFLYSGGEGVGEGGFGGNIGREREEVGVREGQFLGGDVEACDVGAGGEEGGDGGAADVAGTTGYEDVGSAEAEGEVGEGHCWSGLLLISRRGGGD